METNQTHRQTLIGSQELLFLMSTRSMMGFSFGLLLADRFSEDQRKAVGWTLFFVGTVFGLPTILKTFFENQTGRIQPQEGLETETKRAA